MNQIALIVLSVLVAAALISGALAASPGARKASPCAIANDQLQSRTPQEIARIAKAITVTINTEVDSENHQLGTGFFVRNDLVQTVYHVVRGAVDIRVTDSQGKEYSATVRSYNASADLAILDVAEAQNKHWAHFATDSDLEEVGAKVYIYGNPLGVVGTFTDGMLSAIRNHGALLQLSAPLDRGSSGSPVFNSYAQVIGIDDMVMAEGAAELNLAISSNAIIEAQGLKTFDHPNGLNLGVTTDLELRSEGQIDADNAAIKSAHVTDAIRKAYEQILEAVRAASPDKAAGDAWVTTMHDYGPWDAMLTADYWLHQVIERYADPLVQARLLIAVNALLELQGHPLLSPSDDRVREENEKALRQQPGPTP